MPATRCELGRKCDHGRVSSSHTGPVTRSPLVIAAIWTATALTALGCLVGALLAWSDGYQLNWGGTRTGPLAVTMGVAYPVLGAAVLTIRPRDRIGRVLAVTGAFRAFSVIALAWSYHGLVADPGSLPAASSASILGGMAKVMTLALLPLMLVWLPDGRVNPPFRWVPKADAGLVVLVLVAGVVGWPVQGAAILTGSGPPSTRNSIADALLTVLIAGQFVLSTLAVVSLIDKLREPGEVRQQLKWLLFGAVMAVAGNTLGALVPVLWFAPSAGFALLVASLGIGVFRYRLWEVDRLIKGTIIYGLLSAALISVLAGAGVVAGSFLGTTTGSVVASGLAAALAVVLLRPVHRSMQDGLDRVFDRGSWEAIQRLRAFTLGLAGDPPEPGALQALLGEVIADENLILTYRLAGVGQVDPWGQPTSTEWPDHRPVEVVAIGSGSAEIAHRPMTDGDGNRLARVLAESRVALEHGRMQAELHGQLVEIRRSRVRLVSAIDAERRRIERDLHDGVQARLVALGLALRSGQRQVGSEPGATADTLVDEAVSGIQDTICEIRGLAQGVISPLLVSDGLPGALGDLASRIPTPVTADVDIAERPAGYIESTAWYVTCEGIANALKHAPGCGIAVSIRADDHSLIVQVSDGGQGGADAGRGSGLAGLFDRVEAIGGSLQLHSPAGAGTTLRAVLPCG